MPQTTQTRQIRISVDTKGDRELKKIADSLGGMNRNIKSVAGNLGFLSNAFRGFIGFLGVREIVRMSDEMQNLFNRLKLVTGSTEGAEKALSDLNNVASRTNQSVSSVAEIYTRLSVSLGKAGKNSSQVLAITESLINTFRVAGSTGAETANTIIQLSQSFSSGEVRGQELRSILEQNATLAVLLKERFGADIFKKAEQGAIRVTDILIILRDSQKNISAQAKELAPTFEQTLTKAFNRASLAVDRLNREYGISAKFASIVEFSMDNLTNVLLALGTVATVVAISRIPQLIQGLVALRTASIAFAAANPLLLALTTISVGLVLFFQNLEKVNLRFEKFRLSFFKFSESVQEADVAFFKFLERTTGLGAGRLARGQKDLESTRKSIVDIGKAIEESEKKIKGNESPIADPNKAFNDLIKTLEGLEKRSKGTVKIRDVLAELNGEFIRGSISAGEYSKKILNFDLFKLNRDFREGKIDLEAYNTGLNRVSLAAITQNFNEGKTALQEFQRQVEANTITQLDNQLQNGTISLIQYNKEISRLNGQFSLTNSFNVGAQDYIESIGSLSQNVAQGIQNTFSNLENSFIEFTKRGKFNFSNFANAVLDDLTRIIIRSAIIQPLAQGLLNLSFGPSGTTLPASNANFTGNTLTAAKGAAFDNGVRKFASGGIVDRPTFFGYGGGKTGLMGEAGTEAILPLSRGSGGDLGVKASVTPVYINIHNNTGSEVQTKETTGPNGERTIDVLIIGKVREGIASGQFDKALRQGFGLSRKGS